MMRSSIALLVAAFSFVPFARAQELPANVECLIDNSPTPTTTRIDEPVHETFLLDVADIGIWGFDLTGMDKSVKPGDDFAAYVSGEWVKHTVIPPDRSRYGAFDALAEQSDLRVRKLLEELQHTAATMPAEATPELSDRVKLAALFASYMNEAEVERKDMTPIGPMLAAIKAVTTPHDMAAFMGKSREIFAGGTSLFGARVEADEKNPEYNTLYLGQGRLGLPEREYYLKSIYAKQRERYQQYVEQMLGLIGWDDPKGSAQNILDFETKAAEAQWTRAENRDREKTYNPMTAVAMADFAPGFEWQTFLDSGGVGAVPKFVVAQNTAMPKLAKLFAETPMATLQAWQAYNVVDEAAPLLSKRFADAAFDFHGKFMSGAPEERDRAKRAATFCEGVMGEAIGREYAAKYFPPESKAKALTLVNDVKAAMTHRIEKLEWMSPQTKAKALAKMSTFTVKIGYPDKWRDYSMLVVDAGDLFGNATRNERFQYAYRVSKLGQKVDKLEWSMNVERVNAYYNPSQNEIVFPAAILQPPFFDPNADPAINYGGIGAVIGHEITHGFDDQGRKSDEKGVLKDWWTPDDAKRFEAEAAKLGAQYEAFEFPTIPGSHINGKATMGENIADLGGILNGLDAYHLSLDGKPAPVIDGFTGDQRVFLGWAQVWRSLQRDEALKQLLATDSHSPGHIRAFAPLRNVDAWYEAFDIKPGDKEYVPPAERVRIW